VSPSIIFTSTNCSLQYYYCSCFIVRIMCGVSYTQIIIICDQCAHAIFELIRRRRHTTWKLIQSITTNHRYNNHHYTRWGILQPLYFVPFDRRAVFLKVYNGHRCRRLFFFHPVKREWRSVRCIIGILGTTHTHLSLGTNNDNCSFPSRPNRFFKVFLEVYYVSAVKHDWA